MALTGIAACVSSAAGDAGAAGPTVTVPGSLQSSALRALLDPRVEQQARPALQDLASANYARSIAVLIELLRGSELGLVWF